MKRNFYILMILICWMFLLVFFWGCKDYAVFIESDTRPAIISPPDNAFFSDEATLRWTSVYGTFFYEVWIGDDVYYQEDGELYVTYDLVMEQYTRVAKDLKTTNFVLDRVDVDCGEIYYVVRAYDYFHYGYDEADANAFSIPRKLTISLPSITIFDTYQPTVYNEGNEYKVKWIAVEGAQGYEVELDTDPAEGQEDNWQPYTGDPDANVIYDTNASFMVTEPGYYKMRIRPVADDCANAPWVETDEFFNESDCSWWPSQSTGFTQQPLDGDAGELYTITWTTVAEATGYLVEIDNNPIYWDERQGFYNTCIDNPYETEHCISISGNTAEVQVDTPGFYHFRVRAISEECSVTPWLYSADFEVIGEDGITPLECDYWPVGAPVLTQPSDGLQASMFWFKFQKMIQAVGYEVEIDNNPLPDLDGNYAQTIEPAPFTQTVMVDDDPVDPENAGLAQVSINTPGFYRFRIRPVDPNCPDLPWIKTDEFQVISDCSVWPPSPDPYLDPTKIDNFPYANYFGSIEHQGPYYPDPTPGNEVYIRWDALPNATHYEVWIDNDPRAGIHDWKKDLYGNNLTVEKVVEIRSGVPIDVYEARVLVVTPPEYPPDTDATYRFMVAAWREGCAESRFWLTAEFITRLPPPCLPWERDLDPASPTFGDQYFCEELDGTCPTSPINYRNVNREYYYDDPYRRDGPVISVQPVSQVTNNTFEVYWDPVMYYDPDSTTYVEAEEYEVYLVGTWHGNSGNCHIHTVAPYDGKGARIHGQFLDNTPPCCGNDPLQYQYRDAANRIVYPCPTGTLEVQCTGGQDPSDVPPDATFTYEYRSNPILEYDVVDPDDNRLIVNAKDRHAWITIKFPTWALSGPLAGDTYYGRDNPGHPSLWDNCDQWMPPWVPTYCSSNPGGVTANDPVYPDVASTSYQGELFFIIVARRAPVINGIRYECPNSKRVFSDLFSPEPDCTSWPPGSGPTISTQPVNWFADEEIAFDFDEVPRADYYYIQIDAFTGPDAENYGDSNMKYFRGCGPYQLPIEDTMVWSSNYISSNERTSFRIHNHSDFKTEGFFRARVRAERFGCVDGPWSETDQFYRNRWVKHPDVSGGPPPIADQTIVLQNGNMWVWGGQTASGTNTTLYRYRRPDLTYGRIVSPARWDTVTFNASPAPTASEGGFGMIKWHDGSTVPNNQYPYFGGGVDDIGSPTTWNDDFYRFDDASDTTNPDVDAVARLNLPIPVANAAAGSYRDPSGENYGFVIGGRDSGGLINTAQQYTHSTDSWTTVSNTNPSGYTWVTGTGAVGPAPFTLPQLEGSVLARLSVAPARFALIGGVDSLGDPVNTVHYYNLTDGTWNNVQLEMIANLDDGATIAPVERLQYYRGFHAGAFFAKKIWIYGGQIEEEESAGSVLYSSRTMTFEPGVSLGWTEIEPQAALPGKRWRMGYGRDTTYQEQSGGQDHYTLIMHGGICEELKSTDALRQFDGCDTLGLQNDIWEFKPIKGIDWN